MPKKTLTFEEGLNELEQIVEAMEAGTMPLNESFEAYKKGVALGKQLKSFLDDGEKTILLLTKELNGVTETEFPEEL